MSVVNDYENVPKPFIVPWLCLAYLCTGNLLMHFTLPKTPFSYLEPSQILLTFKGQLKHSTLPENLITLAHAICMIWIVN